MIRGIILLILSCVVLTLSSGYTEELSHCNAPEYTRPVYEQAYEFYPTPTTRDIDYSVRPNDCHDLQDFYDRVSVPDHGFIRQTSTSLLSGLILEVTQLLAGIVELVEDLLRLILGHRHECGIITGILDNVLDGLFGIFRGCRDPLCAATCVDRLLDISTRQRQMAHTTQYLENSYSAAQTRHELVNAQRHIYDQYMTVSRNLDTRERNCNSRSGSGGLLGGLVGGLLNPSCGRGFLIDTVFGLVATVVDLVRDILSALGLEIENFEIALNLCLENLIHLGLVVDLFEDVSIHDRYEDEFRHGHLHPMIKQLENHHCVPQNEIYRRYSDIMREEQSRNHYYHLSQLPVRGYRFQDCHMTCRNSKGIDICLDLDILGLLSVDFHLNLDIFCELSFQIEIDADVTLGHGRTHSIHDGVNDYLESMRVVTQGITGCNHVQTSVVSIDLELGLCVARLDLLLGLGQTLCNPLLNLNIGIDIGGILTGVPGHARRHITELNSYNDVESLTHAIRDSDRKINEYTSQGCQNNEEIETHLHDTFDMATHKEAEEAEYQQQYWNEQDHNDEDVIKQAYGTVKVYTDRTNLSHEEYRCALEHYQRAIDITEARIHTSRREYLQTRLRLLQNPTDRSLIEICAAAQIRFENFLQECLFLREYFSNLHAQIQLQIGVLDNDLLGICVDLQARIKLMEDGLISLCADIRLHLSVDLNLLNFNNQLSSVLRGLRPTIRSVECLLDDVLGIGLLGMNCRIEDDCHEGESYEHMRHIHHQILRPAVAACAQNPYVQVSQHQGYQPSSGSNAYKLTFYDTPQYSTSGNVDYAAEETGMTATTTTSSSSSLVFSFLILFLSVLCFF